MVIKSSETKSKQPFLELYKRLSKEVVNGGEKLLKEIQNELFEYKSCGLSDDDNYSKVEFYRVCYTKELESDDNKVILEQIKIIKNELKKST